MHLTAQRDGDNLDVELAGSWRGTDLPAIDAELAAVSLAGVRSAANHRSRVAGAGSRRGLDAAPMDCKAAEKRGVSVEFAGAVPGQLELIESTLAGKRHGAPASSSESTFEPVSALGRIVTRRWVSAEDGARLPRPRDAHLRARLHELAAAAAHLDRAARLRDRHHRDSHRLADRLPDHGDHRLHRRAAGARATAPRSSSSTS